MAKSFKVLIVGGGLTGGLVRHFLNKKLRVLENTNKRVIFDIWEKSSQFGGRMSSHHFRHNDLIYGVDMGAQYITCHDDCKDLIDELVDQNVLYPFPGTIKGMNIDRFSSTNYINPVGLDEIIQYFTQDTPTSFSRELQHLSYEKADNKWIATCTSGSINAYDGVVFTIPAPNILQLQGNFRNFLPNIFDQRLSSVQYSSRFALSLLVSNVSGTAIPWTSQYVIGDEMIKYISVENKKRCIVTNSNEDECLALIVHTSIPFYHQHENDSDASIIEKICAQLSLHLPILQSKHVIIQSSHLHRWKLSQVVPSSQFSNHSEDTIDGGRMRSVAELDKSVLLFPSSNNSQQVAFLGFAGDYFTESNFNGCTKSARDLVEKMIPFCV